MRKISIALLLLVACFKALSQTTPEHFFHSPANSGVNNSFFLDGLCNKFVFIYTQAEIAGMTNPVTSAISIDTIWFRHGGGSSNPSTTFTNLVVTMGHTTLSAPVANFATNFNAGAPLVVLNAPSYTYTYNLGAFNVPADNWTPIVLQTPFSYNFTDNLAVQFEFAVSSAAIAGHYADNGGVPITQYTSPFSSAVATAITSRPMFGISSGCGDPVQLGADTTICSGQQLTLDAGFPGSSHLWSTGATSQTILVNTAGSYSVTVTDSCGARSDTILVTTSPQPIANAGNNLNICAGDTINLAGSASGAGPNYTYSWSPSSGLSNPNIANPAASPFSTTTYTLNVSSNGCPGVPDQVTVSVNPVPIVNAGPNLSACFGNQASLTAVSAGANPVTYTWAAGGTIISQNGPSSVNVVPTTSTTYTVVATSGAGCSSNPDTVVMTVVPFPQANAGPDSGICEGDTATLSGSVFFLPGDTLTDLSGLTVSWSPTAGLGNPSGFQTTAVVGASTTFTLTVSNQGCISQNTVRVDVFPIPTAIASASDSLICSNDSLQLLSTGSVATNLLWTPSNLLSNPASANPVAYPQDSTVFVLTASNGPCVVTDSVLVEVGLQPDAFFVTSDTIVCVRQPFLADDQSTGFLDLNWTISDGRTDTLDGDITHFFFAPGLYNIELSATGELGCTDSYSFQMVVIPGPTADFTSNPPFTTPQTFPGPDFAFTELAEDEVEWIWRFPVDSVLYGPSVTHVFQTPGSFTVELLVIDEQGCRDSVQHVVVILPNDVGQQNVFSPNGDGVNDRFLIEYAGNREYTLMVFDRWGKRLFLTKDKLEGWDGKNALGIDVPEGVYFYTLWVGPDVHQVGHVTLVR
jgi:gliding motility-associated-like protein